MKLFNKTKEKSGISFLNKKTKKNKVQFFAKEKENMCFYDSEFNAYDDNKDLNIPQEVVSIGMCIINNKGNIVDKYYSLIKLKGAKKITNRCKEITGIKDEDMEKAIAFPECVKEVVQFLKKNKVKNIYAYGIEDKKALLKTSSLYHVNSQVDYILKKIKDIKIDFKKQTKNKLSDQGLSFLKKACNLKGDVRHNALFDAIDLANVYDVIFNKGLDEEYINDLLEEREEISNYKRSRRIKEENQIVAPENIINSRDEIIKFLKKIDIPCINKGVKNALIDDLQMLFGRE